jgi:putative ABC transport system ATP-binding protein
MGLEDRLHSPAGTLSGGQRQALSLLMATIEKPDILLLDEHTASLDPVSEEKVIALTCEIIEKEKLTVLWVTHSLTQAARLGNRTLVLVQGEAVREFRDDAKAALTAESLKPLIGRL